VLQPLPALHAALDAVSRQHASFLKLLQACEDAIQNKPVAHIKPVARIQPVAPPKLKGWSLSVNLG
jgi:hypothetical protein